MSNALILFFCGFIVWIGLNWPPDLHDVLSGIVVAIVVAIMTGDLFKGKSSAFRRGSRYLWFLYYIPFFIWEVLKANIDVAYRVAHPAVPIRPGIVKVKTTLTSDTALTFLANSITLTPGTLTVDVDSKNGYLYVHWINVLSPDVEEATAHIVARFEKILREIFE